MKNAIILHGKPSEDEYYNPEYPSASNSHWLPWLQKQLLVKGIAASTPEVPLAYKPQYEIWKKEFERFDVNEETILIGHSCGGGFLVRWLSENKNVNVDKVILVAPWLDLNREVTTDFFDFEIDQNIAGRANKMIIFNSDNDYDDIHESVAKIRQAIPNITYREFHGYGHFTQTAMQSAEFPELLTDVLA